MAQKYLKTNVPRALSCDWHEEFSHAKQRVKCNNIDVPFMHFFDFFLIIFIQIELKTNVCFNLTTLTWYCHLNVSKLFGQCFTGFFLTYCVFTWPWIIHISNFCRKIEKRSSESLKNVLKITLQKFAPFCKCILGGDRFKSVILSKKRRLLAVLELSSRRIKKILY